MLIFSVELLLVGLKERMDFTNLPVAGLRTGIEIGDNKDVLAYFIVFIDLRNCSEMPLGVTLV